MLLVLLQSGTAGVLVILGACGIVAFLGKREQAHLRSLVDRISEDSSAQHPDSR